MIRFETSNGKAISGEKQSQSKWGVLSEADDNVKAAMPSHPLWGQCWRHHAAHYARGIQPTIRSLM